MEWALRCLGFKKNQNTIWERDMIMLLLLLRKGKTETILSLEPDFFFLFCQNTSNFNLFLYSETYSSSLQDRHAELFVSCRMKYWFKTFWFFVTCHPYIALFRCMGMYEGRIGQSFIIYKQHDTALCCEQGLAENWQLCDGVIPWGRPWASSWLLKQECQVHYCISWPWGGVIGNAK